MSPDEIVVSYQIPGWASDEWVESVKSAIACAEELVRLAAPELSLARIAFSKDEPIVVTFQDLSGR